MNDATWINGTRSVTGRWSYCWHSDRFVIHLDKRDRVTGQCHSFAVAGDRPEWGMWRLAEAAREVKP